MWLSRLDLLAFGRFTEARLTLGPGFHLIYGRNEAGKSTALRAIRQLLFGFDERTVDNFIHPNPNLRIGGVVCDHTGRQLEVIRRKTRKDSLRGPDDVSLIDPSSWHDLICQIDADTFSRRYGIDYEQLVEGGREIATGNGDLGEILFATGSGVMDLAAVQKRLSDEAAELFRPLGKKQRVNQAILEWQQQRDDVVAKQLSVASWEEADHRRQDVHSRLSDVSAHLSRLSIKRNRLRRQCAAIPLMQEQEALEQSLLSQTFMRLLPADFSRSRQEAQLLFNQARASQQSAAEVQHSAIEELNQLHLRVNVIDRAADLTRLFTEWGSYCKAQLDRSGLVDQRDRHRSGVVQRLRAIGREPHEVSASELILDRAQRTRVGQLGRQFSALQQAVQQSEQQLTVVSEQIGGAQTELANQPRPQALDELRKIVRQVLNEGDLETRLNKTRSELTLLHTDADAQRAQLSHWTGSLSDLRLLDTPSSATIDRYEAEFRTIDAEQSLLQSKLIEWESDHSRLNEDIDRLRREFRIPLETDLTVVRDQRDQTWTAIRRQWAAQQFPTEELIQAYEAQSREADAVADLLKNEAERVAQLTEQLADRTAIEVRQHEVSIRQAELNATRLQKVTAWRSEWRQFDISNSSPRDMHSWLLRRDTLLQSATLIQRRSAEVAELEQTINEQIVSLSSLLIEQAISRNVPPPKKVVGRKKTMASAVDHAEQSRTRQQLSFGWEPGVADSEQPGLLLTVDFPSAPTTSLTSLLEQAEEQINLDETQRRGRLALEKELERLQSAFTEVARQAQRAREKLADWQDEWQAAIAGLKLNPQTSPDAAASYVETLGEVLDLERQIEQLSERINGIDADSETFDATMRTIRLEIAPDLIELPLSDAISVLRTRLSESQRDQQKFNELQVRKEHAEQQFLQVRDSRIHLGKLLDELCRTAGLNSPQQSSSDEELLQVFQDLETAEIQSRQRRATSEELERIHQRLQELAEDQPLADFLVDIRSQPLDGLDDQLQQLGQTSRELEVERDALNHQLGGFDEQLRRMNGSADAAEADEIQRHSLARIRTDAEQYIRLKLASSVLQTAIERYREKTREPILRIASELFRELTLESFTGLRVDEQANKSVLVGLRADGRSAVTVGGMSEGTCDQLYLALRLASLQLESAPRNRLPFIVDDILIQFDDARAAAALRILERFSEHRQVIFFTHHEHLLDVAQKNLSGSHSVHRLDA